MINILKSQKKEYGSDIMNYWLCRSAKTIFFITIYYILLFCSVIVYNPYSDMVDISCGEKLLLGMGMNIPIVFVVVSLIVILWHFIQRKEWESWLSPAFSYFVFFLVHIVYMLTYSFLIEVFVDFSFYCFIGIICIIISMILGKLFYREIEEDDTEDVISG